MHQTNSTQSLALPSEGLAKLPAVMNATGLSRSAVYAKVKNREFPAPVKLGERSVAWPVQAVRDWINDRVNAAKAPPTQSSTGAARSR
jgi:prophage regulatory protein